MINSKKHTAKKKPLYRRVRLFLRRKVFNKRAAEGSVTIFLIIIMLPMLIFSCSVIDLCKIFMARNSTDSALELAMNSRLTSYDDILKDMYGILASSADEDELAKNLTTYYKMTLESSTGSTLSSDEKAYVENFFSSLFNTNTSALDDAVKDTNGYLYLFENENAKFSVTPLATSSASNPEVMHKQIVEYMKYRGPVYLATGSLDMITAFSDVSNQANAAKAQIDYEKQLKSTGNAFADVYKNLNEFLETSNTFEAAHNFSGFYDGGLVPPDNDFKDYVDLALPAAYVCSFFGGAFNSSGKLSFVSSAEDAFEGDYERSSNSSTAVKNLSAALDELSGIDDDAADAVDIFGDSDIYAANFINSNKNSRAVDLLNNRFGALIKDHPNVVNDDVISLLDAYNDARAYFNYIDKQLERITLTDSEKETLKKEQDELNKVLDEAESVVGEIERAANAIKRFMESQLEEAKYNYVIAAGRLSEIYGIVDGQLDKLDNLLDGGIDKIKKELDKAAQKAREYEGAVDKVKTESEKSNMTEVYNSGAAKVKELSLDDAAVNELKVILGRLRDVYTAEKKSIESIQYLRDARFSISNPMVKDGKVETDIMKLMKVFCDKHDGKNVSAWYDYNSYSEDRFFSYDKQNGENIGAWNSLNSTIMGNEFYKTVVKYGKEKETDSEDNKKKAEDSKKDIENIGKKAGENNDAKKDNKKSDDSNNDNSDDNKNVWFVPNCYPTYSAYITDLKKAYDADKSKDSKLGMLDDNSFSFKTSETEPADEIASTNLGSGDDDISQNAAKLLSSIGTFFANLAKAARDDLYIAEYLTENFPCFTTTQEDKNAGMISGEKFIKDGKPTVVCKSSSLEYILYGDINGGEAEAALSVAKASAVVFGVRFALNLIYALTSADLALQIEPIVAPLEVIPFAGPIVRTVILIGLALGESSIDLGLLLANQKVALFKSASTWICSPKGIATAGAQAFIDLAADKAGDVIDFAVDKVTNKLVEAEDALAKSLEDKADDIEKKVDDYAKELLADMREEVENDVWKPIISCIQSYIDDFDPEYESLLTVDMIRGDLEKMIVRIRGNLGLDAPDASNDMLKGVEREIFDYLQSEAVKEKLARTIHDNIPKLYEASKSAINDATDALDKKVKGLLSDVENKISSYFDEKTSELCKKVKDAVSSTANSLKGKTEEYGKSLANKLKSGVNEKLRGIKADSHKVDLSKNTGSSDDGLFKDKSEKPKKKGSTFKVSYKDYMYVFTVLGLIINENNMLMRVSQLMSANIELKADGSTRSAKPENAYTSKVTYDLNKAYTLFKGEAGSKTRTTFFGTTWNKQEQKWVHPASNVYTYKASTYVGY